jgi:hypothetical protein
VNSDDLERAMADTTGVIVAFLRGIGIAVTQGRVPEDAFLPGVRIAEGSLVYDPSALRWPGDLLHEAGHIATTPAAQRHRLSDDLDGQESPEHGGEIEATAWAYAASVALGLDPRVLFHEGGYHGKSAGLILTYGAGVYPGCKGLADAGMTRIGDAAREQGVAPYPHMVRWLRG